MCFNLCAPLIHIQLPKQQQETGGHVHESTYDPLVSSPIPFGATDGARRFGLDLSPRSGVGSETRLAKEMCHRTAIIAQQLSSPVSSAKSSPFTFCVPSNLKIMGRFPCLCSRVDRWLARCGLVLCVFGVFLIPSHAVRFPSRGVRVPGSTPCHQRQITSAFPALIETRRWQPSQTTGSDTKKTTTLMILKVKDI